VCQFAWPSFLWIVLLAGWHICCPCANISLRNVAWILVTVDDHWWTGFIWKFHKFWKIRQKTFLLLTKNLNFRSFWFKKQNKKLKKTSFPPLTKVEVNGEICVFRTLPHLRRRPESRCGDTSVERSVRAVRANDVSVLQTFNTSAKMLISSVCLVFVCLSCLLVGWTWPGRNRLYFKTDLDS